MAQERAGRSVDVCDEAHARTEATLNALPPAGAEATWLDRIRRQGNFRRKNRTWARGPLVEDMWSGHAQCPGHGGRRDMASLAPMENCDEGGQL